MFDLGVPVLTEFDPDGFLGAQPDVLGEGDSGVAPYELHHPYGFQGRPSDPDVDGSGTPKLGATLAYWLEGSRGHAFALGDPRTQLKLPQLKPGESMQYGPNGQFIRCHDDGTISLFTTDDGTPDGRSVILRHGPSDYEYSSPHIRHTEGPLGFHVKHSGGARIDLGSIGGLPTPLNALSSYLKLTAATISLNASAISLGTDAGATNLAAIAALQVLLDAIGLAMTTFVAPAGGGPCTNVNLGAVATALTAYDLLALNIAKIV